MRARRRRQYRIRKRKQEFLRQTRRILRRCYQESEQLQTSLIANGFVREDEFDYVGFGVERHFKTCFHPAVHLVSVTTPTNKND